MFFLVDSEAMNDSNNHRASWPRRLVRSWIGQPAIDLIVTALICVIVDRVMAEPPGTTTARQIALQTMVGFCVGAIAFAVTGTSILLAVPPGQHLQKLLADAGHDLTRLVMIAVGSLTAAAVALSWTIALESSSPGWLLATIELAFCLIATMAQFRLVWLFYQIFLLLAVDRPKNDEDQKLQGST